MALPLGAGCRTIMQLHRMSHLCPEESDYLEKMHPGETVTLWNGKEDRRVPYILSRPIAPAASGSRRTLYSIFAKGEGARPKHNQPSYWNCLDISNYEFKLSQSKSREYGDGENGLMRQALRYCEAVPEPEARVLLAVFNGQLGSRCSRPIYYLFYARLLREEKEQGLFIGQIIEPLATVPRVGAQLNSATGSSACSPPHGANDPSAPLHRPFTPRK